VSLRFLYMLLTTPIACAFGLWRPFVGLLSLIFLYYFRPDIWNMPKWFRPIQFITISVGLGWLMRAKSFRLDSTMGFSLFLLLAQLASAVMAVRSSDTAFTAVETLAKVMTVQWLTLQLVTTSAQVNLFLWANIFGMLWNMKTVMVVGLRGGGDGDFRVNVAVGQGGGANYLAMLFVMFLPFLLIRFQTGRKWERMWSLGLIPIILMCIVFTGSRGGFLALGVVLLHAIVRSRYKVLGLVLAGLAAAFVWNLTPETQKTRFTRGVGAEGTRDWSAESRIRLWEAGWNMFKDHPLLGVGPDNFPLLSPRYAGFYAGKNFERYIPGVEKPGFVAHSTWFQTLAEGGVLSFVPLATILILCWVILGRVRKTMPRDTAIGRELYSHSVALEGCLLAMVVGSSFGSHMKLDPFWWYIGAIGALGLNAGEFEEALREKKRREALLGRRAASLRAAGHGTG
jgi:O-antigen ligase